MSDEQQNHRREGGSPPETRRRFILAAGAGLAGTAGAFALPASASAEAPAGNGVLTTARLRNHRALTEAISHLRVGTPSGAAQGGARLAGLYAGSSTADRYAIDVALDALDAGRAPGTFADLDVQARLADLAEQLCGPSETRIESAISLVDLEPCRQAVGSCDPVGGRLLARAVRAYVAQRGPRPATGPRFYTRLGTASAR